MAVGKAVPVRQNRSVIVIMLSALGLLVLWTIWFEWQSHGRALESSRREAVAMVGASAAALSSSLRAVDVALISALSVLEAGSFDVQSRYASIVSQLRRHAMSTPAIDDILVFDQNGDVVFHSGYDILPRLNVADRQYFRFFADGLNEGNDVLFVGDPVTGRISGEWFIAMARRLSSPEGAFSGVILATVGTVPLASHVRYLASRTGASVVLVTGTGAVVEAEVPPQRNNWTGRKVYSLPLGPLPVEESLLVDTVLEDEQWMTVIRRVDDLPLGLILSRPWSVALAEWYSTLVRELFLLFGALVALSLLWWPLSRAIADRNRLFELSPDPVCILDPEGAFVSVNPAWGYVLGVEPGSLLRKLLSDFVVSDDRKAFHDVVARLIEGARVEEFVVHVTGAGGNKTPLSFTAVSDSAGIFAIARNISRRLSAESALRQSEQRFRDVAEASGEFVWEVDAAGCIVFMTERVQGVLGYRPPDMKGCLFVSFMRGETRRFLESSLGRLTGFRMEADASRADGTSVRLRLSGLPILTEDGHLNGFRGTALDITESYLARQALQDSEERFRTIVNTVVDGIITINEKGKVLSVNPAAEKMFGYAAADMMGHDVSMLMPEPYAAHHGTYLADYLEHGLPKAIGMVRELEAKRKNGELFPVELAVSEVWIGGVRLFIGVVRDISERKRVERMKSEFVSTVSHELRTPLTSIRGSLGLVGAGAAGVLPEKANELIHIAHSNCERLIRLVNDILDIQKIEAGRMVFDMQVIDFSDVIRRSITDNEAFANQYKVKVIAAALPDHVMVHGDRDRLFQVVTNLLSNAVKFSPSGGAVNVGVQLSGPMVHLTVEDFGPGIPESFRDDIFQKFSQADSTDRRAKGGTGLGLSIAKAIVEHHGGHIGFHSVEGQGTTFYVDIPAVGDSGRAQPTGHGKEGSW
ncbi:PAS domain S-box protein [Haematospirillum sp. H4890]|nr:PAS domain S-box protein [Haematospirillum sp. H4890]